MPEEIIQWDTLTTEERNLFIHMKVMELPLQTECLACITWEDDPVNNTPRGWWHCQVGHRGVFADTTHFMLASPLRYTESMDAAWLVLQKIAARWDEKDENLFDEFRDELLECSGNEIYPASSLLLRMAQWTPETVCVAALKSVEYDVAEKENQS